MSMRTSTHVYTYVCTHVCTRVHVTLAYATNSIAGGVCGRVALHRRVRLQLGVVRRWLRHEYPAGHDDQGDILLRQLLWQEFQLL